MTITYFKRYKMQIDLPSMPDFAPRDYDGYQFLPWSSSLLKEHAEAKFESFRSELDSHVFPCLGKLDGCLRLMTEISYRTGFVPEATWLVVHGTEFHGRDDNCGTVQGIREDENTGSIQNLGIVPSHRGNGVGSELLRRSLVGFKSVGLQKVSLEVTAHNESAIKLYQRIGFEISQIVYKNSDLIS